MIDTFHEYSAILANADAQDFSEAELAGHTFFELVENTRSETSTAAQITSLLNGVKQSVIDCFVSEEFLNDHLNEVIGTDETYENCVILARGIVSETLGFHINYATKLDIGWVVRNRKESPSFPNTYLGVLSQPAQFSGWPDKAKTYAQCASKSEKFRWALSYYAALMVTAGQDTVSGALHFYSPYIPTPSWAQGKTPLSRPATEYLINVSAQGKKFHGASFLFFNNIN